MQTEQIDADFVWEGLDHLSQGLSIFDKDLRLVLWNSKFVDLLDVPKHLTFAGTPFESFIRHNAQNGEYGDGDILN